MTIAILIAFFLLFSLFAVWLSTKRKAEFDRSLELVFLRILIPKKESDQDEKKETTRDFREYIGLTEQLFSSLRTIYSSSMYAKLFGQKCLSFEYIAHKGEIFFFVVVPRPLKELVEKQITSFFSDAIIDEEEEIDIFADRKVAKAQSIGLKKPFYLGIKTHQKLESDPINSLTNALSKMGAEESCALQFLLSPIEDSWQKKGDAFMKKFSKKWGSFWSIFTWVFNFLFVLGEEDKKKQEEKAQDWEVNVKEKAKKTGYETCIRMVVTGQSSESVDVQLNNIFGAFSQFSGPEYNTFSRIKGLSSAVTLHKYVMRYFASNGRGQKRVILNIEEIASLFHFPSAKYNKTPEIRWQNFKVVKAPNNLPEEGVLLGHNIYRGVKKEVRIKNEDRFRHFYVIGQTGTGKTSILQVMARQDIQNKKGIAIIDPHGDFVKDMLPFIPRERAEDLVLFDPSDTSRPLGINMLEAHDDDEKQAVTQESLNIMLKLYGNEVFGPRMQDYFRNGVLTLMDYPGGGAITDLVRLFTDDAFQKARVDAVKNPIVKSWWQYTFASMGDREKAEMIPFWAAKFGSFVTNTMIRNIVGQTKSAFNVYDAMQDEKILLINLSKGILWDFNSQLLGLILVSKIQMAAMRRQSIEKEARKDFFLYIDEFQNYITDSIESILSEARKYRLGLAVGHQYLKQLEKSDALTKSSTNLRDAIFGNVGTMMSYKIGPDDADIMAKQFAPTFSELDMINIDARKWVMRLCIDGQPSPAFSIIPVNPNLEKGNKDLWQVYRTLSRLKYGREREFVDKEILLRIGGTL